MRIRFLYHKPIGERGVGKAIVALTWIYGLFYNWKVLKYNYSHEEIWLPDEDEEFSRIFHPGYRPAERMYFGKCLSSTTRGDAEGVRFAPANEVLHNPQRWDYIECEADPERVEVAIAEAQKLIGARYDFLGIFGFLNPFAFQDEKRWYCSELCDWFKFLTRIMPRRHKRISPRRSAYLLAKVWGQPKALE